MSLDQTKPDSLAPANFSNYILGRPKCTLLTTSCLAGFDQSLTKYCSGCQGQRNKCT